jgi:hypothetical protein
VTKRFLVAIGAGILVMAILLAVLGRWERGRHADEENREMAVTLAAIGRLDNPSLSMYRLGVGFGFDCLLYKRGANRFALEACIDRSGRVVETIDRRGTGDPKVASLREDPERATNVVDRALVERLLRRLGAPER